MQEFQKLARLLEKEVAFHDELLELLMRERVAIVKLQQEEIEKLAAAKAQLFEKGSKLTEQRSNLLKLIHPKENVLQEPVKLGEILPLCSQINLRAEISETGEQLKSVAERVREMHQHNAQLIRQSLGLIATTVSLFRSGVAGDLPMYNQSGALTSDKKKSTSSERTGVVTRQA